jgi:hypothetical protein
MCCFITVLFLFGPRLALVVWYLINPVYISAAFQGFLVPCLGFLFLPWTLLAYFAVYPGGVTGFEWVIVGLGLLADIATYGGGGYGNRSRLPGYQQTPKM